MKNFNQIKSQLQSFFKRSQIFLLGLFLVSNTIVFAAMPSKQVFEAENAKLIGGATKVADKDAFGGQLLNLAQSGQGLEFENLTEASKLAIRYASVNVGTISVLVNDMTATKVNIHSSGAVTGSFIQAIIDITIPKGANLVLRVDASDVTLAIDQIIIGTGDLGLPPDIWNLPSLPIAEGL